MWKAAMLDLPMCNLPCLDSRARMHGRPRLEGRAPKYGRSRDGLGAAAKLHLREDKQHGVYVDGAQSAAAERLAAPGDEAAPEEEDPDDQE